MKENKTEMNRSRETLRFFVESSLARNMEIAVINGKCVIVEMLIPGESVKRSDILQRYVEIVDAQKEKESDGDMRDKKA